MTITPKFAIIVAGGSGQRMGSKIPKQFLEIKGRPILMRTIESFHQYSQEIKLILVLPSTHINTWKELCERHQFHIPVNLESGGDTRFQSVKNGLKLIGNEGLVAIHDGVRPLVDFKMIEASYKTAERNNSAVAAIPINDSIRKVSPDGSIAVNRNAYRIIQTPQTFKANLIKKAYEIEEKEIFTDDASVWEAAGNQVSLYQGNAKNLKITTIQDLVTAEVLMKFQ